MQSVVPLQYFNYQCDIFPTSPNQIEYLNNIEIFTEDDMQELNHILFDNNLKNPNGTGLISNIDPASICNDSRTEISTFNLQIPEKNLIARSREKLLKMVNTEIGSICSKETMKLFDKEILYPLSEKIIDLQNITFLLVKYISLGRDSILKCHEKEFVNLCKIYANSTFETFFKRSSDDQTLIEFQHELLNTPARIIFSEKVLQAFKALGIDMNIRFPNEVFSPEKKFKFPALESSIQELKLLAGETGLQSLIDECKSQNNI